MPDIYARISDMSNNLSVSDERHLRLIYEESRGWIGDGRCWTEPLAGVIASLHASKYCADEVGKILGEKLNDCQSWVRV